MSYLYLSPTRSLRQRRRLLPANRNDRLLRWTSSTRAVPITHPSTPDRWVEFWGFWAPRLSPQTRKPSIRALDLRPRERMVGEFHV